MSKARVAVLKVISHELTVTPAATQYGYSQRRGKRVIILIDEHTVTVVHLYTGDVIATHRSDPDRNYWRNQQREPGRWPDSR